MDEKTQNMLLIAGGVLAAGGLAYWHFSTKKAAAAAALLTTIREVPPTSVLNVAAIAPYSGPKTATTNLKYVVKASAPRALVRTGPTEDYPSFGAFQSGDSVTSTGFAVVDPASRTAYVEVMTPDGKTGWVSIAFLDLVTAASATTPEAIPSGGLASSAVPPKVFVPAPSGGFSTSMRMMNPFMGINADGGVQTGYKFPQQSI